MAVIRDDQQGKLVHPGPAAPAGVATPPLTPSNGAVANGPAKTAAEPAAPQTQKPIPVLLQHGFSGGIDVFNQRVQAVHDQYSKQFGIAPAPNLVFDIAKSPVGLDDFPKLFQVPASPQAATNRAVAVQHGYNPDGPVIPTAKDLATGITTSAIQGNYKDYVEQHQDLIHQLSYENKNDAATIAGAVFRAKRYTAQHDLDQKVANGDITPLEATTQLQQMGFLPTAAFKDPKGIVGEVAIGVGQITDSLVHSPAGLYAVARAAGLDTNDAFNGDYSFSRTRQIAKETARQTAQDFEHPLRNPGYLFLDTLGLASAGAGVAVRGTAALGAIGEAGDDASIAGRLGAAAKAGAKRPELARKALDYGGYREQMPLSQNPLVATVQKVLIDWREAAANAKLGAGVPAGIRATIIPDVAQEWLDNNLSFPKKLSREADARKRTDHIAQMTLARELDHAAGRSVTQARVQAAIPTKLRGALTRGEQKAIQVLSWDDPDPLKAEREFHQRMIDMGVGDPKAHRRQIADLKLAKKALDNPSPRFQHALDLTKQVIARQQEIKINDLGLQPETAEGRVAKPGAILRGEDITGVEGEGGQFKQLRSTDKSKVVDVVPLERTSGESFYLPTQRRGKVKPTPSERAGYFATKGGPYGIPYGRDIPELTHEFTGKALTAGDYRIDATSLATEAYGRTVRAATIRAEHAKLWRAASDTPRSRFDIPIRDSNTISDQLRQVVARLDEGDFNAEDAKGLPADMADLINELYPDARKLTEEQIEGVKWIDGRLLGEGASAPTTPTGIAKAASVVNTPVRFATLYLRPAYILNKLGNHAMLAFDQGWQYPQNFVKAMSAETRYGEENTRTIRALVGAGRSASYVTSQAGKTANAVAEFWTRVTDRDERVAAFVYYMERKGYKTREDVTRLLNHPDARADLNEIKRRANKSLVEFDNLTEFEKNTLRHFIFVYPWVSRSLVYSIRAILDHPVKAALLSKLGQQDLEDDPLFKHAPSYFKQIGYIPIGYDHQGNPKVVNPTSVNTFSTLGDFLALTRAATSGDKYASAADFLGPFPTYLMHAVSGRDEYGNVYPGSPWLGAAKDVLSGLPQISAAEKAANYKNGSLTTPPLFSAEGPQVYAKAYAHNKQFAKPAPEATDAGAKGPYQTKLTPEKEAEFEQWVKANKVPFDVNASTVDYDMRGFWLANGTRAANGHFPDTFKTPYDSTFSNESKYATPNNPFSWQGNNLVDTRNGQLIFGTPTKASRVPNIADRASLEASLNANLKKTVMSPGWLDGYGSLIAGGLSPRTADLPALAARYWRDQTPQVRHARELDLLNRAVNIQGEALGRPVPANVRSAIRDQANIDYGYKQFLTKTGRTPTDKERAGFTINYLAEQGLISESQQKKFQTELGPLADATDINRLKNGLLDKYANGAAVRVWDQDVRAYASLTNLDVVNQKAAELYTQGLSAQKRYQAPAGKLEDYGRRYVEFTHQIRQLQQQIKSGTKTEADLRAFQDLNDKPVDGLPSFVRMSWANLAPVDQQQAVTSAAGKPWGSLTAFEKTLLGRPSTAAVTAGWARLSDLVTEQRAALKREGRSFPAGYTRVLAQYVQRGGGGAAGPGAPGLVQDYDFSKQPVFERMKLYKPIQKSPNNGQWVQLLNLAKGMHAYLAQTDSNGTHVYDSAQIRQMWSDYTTSSGFQAWLREHPSFKAEVQGYGKTFLKSLVG